MKTTKSRIRTARFPGIAALLIALLVLPALLAAETKNHYKIGVLANRGKEQCRKQWQHTALDLQDKIPGTTFTIVPLNFGETEAAVKNRAIDFIITNSGDYVDLEARYGAQRIATLKNICFDKVVTVFGGVIFTRADRGDINRLEDLKHKKFIAVDKDSFGGWLAAWRELKDHGINPRRDFSEMKFGGTQDSVVRAVQKGEVDAGTVRTDTLEHMAAEGKIRLLDFKILHAAQAELNYPHFLFLFSTRLYPEWPFVKLQHTPLEITEQVCAVLLSIQRDDIAAVTGQYAGWTPPLNYQSVHECLKELRYKPYEDFGRITARDVLRTYWPIILSIAILIGIMALIINYMVALNRKLKQSQLIIQRNQEELRLSEQKFRSVIEESTEGILLCDEQGMLIAWNRSLEKITGFKLADVIGRPIWDVQFEMALEENKTPEAYARLKTMLTGLLKTGEAPLLRQPVDWNIQHHDGMQRDVQTVTFPVKLGHGFMIVGFLLDITERKAAEQQLTATKDYLENIIEGSLDAIVVNDSMQHIAQCNRYFLVLIGYTEDEVLGHYMYDFTPNVGETYESTVGDTIRINDDFYNDSVAMIGRLLETGKAANWQTYYLCKNGKVIPVEQNSFMLKDKQGNIIGSAAIIRDITERRRTENERERLIAEIQKSLDQIKTLRGIVPICANCKKIRDDQGYWNQVEVYVRDHTEAEFTHSICPECTQKLYPEIYAEMCKNKK